MSAGILAIAATALVATIWMVAIAPALDRADSNVRQMLSSNPQLLESYETARELQDAASTVEDIRDNGRIMNQLLIWVAAPVGIIGAGIVTAKQAD